MLRLVNKRGISAGFLSYLNLDLYFNFETGCVRNFVRTRMAVVGSDCEPGLIKYSVCTGAGEKRESVFSCVPYLGDRYYTASKKNFFTREMVSRILTRQRKTHIYGVRLFPDPDVIRIRELCW